MNTEQLLLIGVGVVYFGVGLMQVLKGFPAHSLFFFGCTIGNIGLALTAVK